jgi:hypothetical protein
MQNIRKIYQIVYRIQFASVCRVVAISFQD